MALTQKYHFEEEATMTLLAAAIQTKLDALTALGVGKYSIVQIETIFDGTNYVAAMTYQSDEPAP